MIDPTTNIPAPVPQWERRNVSRASIAVDPKFKSRHGRRDPLHVKTLAAAVRRGGALTPVTLWNEECRNSLVLLDGDHRLAAYGAAGWRGAIPARVVSCNRRDAPLIAAAANTRDAKPLTQSERADIAWRLVREADAHFTKPEIAGASGIAERTVTTMRARWRTIRGTGRELTGFWFRDRKDTEGDDGDMQGMTDAERLAKIEAIAGKMRKAAGNVAFRDEQLFAEALDMAFGKRLRVAIDFLYADEVDEWASIDVSDRDDEDGEDDEDAAF